MTNPPRELGRREAVRAGAGAVLALAGAGALAGCSLNNPYNDDAETPAAEAVRRLEPDVAVAVQAVTRVRAAQVAVSTTGEAHPALAARLAALAATHTAHLDALVDAVPEGLDTGGDATDYTVPARPRAALARLVTTEKALHDELVGLAMRAESGPFARLLGSMAAALSQQLKGLAG